MAKRRFKKVRRGFARVKAHYSRHKESYGELGTILGAMAYGAIRQKASDFVMPVTSKIPMLGNASDEVVLGVSAWALNKFVGRKVPMLKPLFKGAIIIESARIGELIATGNLGIGQSTATGGQFLG
jgi:hypothetical protein